MASRYYVIEVVDCEECGGSGVVDSVHKHPMTLVCFACDGDGFTERRVLLSDALERMFGEAEKKAQVAEEQRINELEMWRGPRPEGRWV